MKIMQIKIFSFLLLFLHFEFIIGNDVVDEGRIHRYGSNVFKSGEIKHSVVPLPHIPEEKQLGISLNRENLGLYQGDILFEKQPKDIRNKRKIVNEYDPTTASRTRWPNKIVPYEIDQSMPNEMVKRVQTAIEHWHQRSCIRFELYDPKRHRYYRSKLRMLTTENSLCASFVGYREDQPMYVSYVYLGIDCTLGSVIHELGHTIGFRHEQSRIDRNSHVSVNFNLVADDFRGQYDIMENPQPNYYGVQYDLYSIMHYSGQDGVLRALDSKRNFLMGQRVGLSFLDIKLANFAYKCNENCRVKYSCLNEGFQDQNCKCFCPEGFTGQYCETVIANKMGNSKVAPVDNTGVINLDCDFDNTICSWSQDRLRASDDWVYNNPSLGGITETQQFFSRLDQKFKTGPQNGGNANGQGGRYVYLNSLRKESSNANAILMSPQFTTKTPYLFCIQFWFQMYQSGNNPSYPLKIGNLSIHIMNSDGSNNIIWMANGNQGVNWKYGEAQVNIRPPAGAVYFEAQLSDYNYGDIALSKIRMKNGRCTSNSNANNRLAIIKWNEWSKCSVTCGEGTQQRTQKCNDGDETCQPTVDVQKCVMPPCPVARWTEWSDWSTCTETCNQGYQYRLRNCLNPDTSMCTGERTQYQNCIIKECETTTTLAPTTLLSTTEESNDINTTSALIEKAVSSDSEKKIDNNTTANNLTSARDQKSHVLKAIRSLNRVFKTKREQVDSCGGEFLINNGQKLTIKSPNYPEQYDSNLKCNYYLKSPSNTKITVKLIDIDLEESQRDTCIDGLEFRYFSLGQPGPVYCGRLQYQTNPLTITSYSNFTMIIFRSSWGQSVKRRGFLAEATAN